MPLGLGKDPCHKRGIIVIKITANVPKKLKKLCQNAKKTASMAPSVHLEMASGYFCGLDDLQKICNYNAKIFLPAQQGCQIVAYSATFVIIARLFEYTHPL